MNLLSRFSGFCRLLNRRTSLWLSVVAIAACLFVNPAHAQRRPPTIPNPNGNSPTFGGPATIGGQSFPNIGSPPATNFAPALSAFAGQPVRLYYVYYRLSPEAPWACYGSYNNQANAHLTVNWLRQRGNEAFSRQQ